MRRLRRIRVTAAGCAPHWRTQRGLVLIERGIPSRHGFELLQFAMDESGSAFLHTGSHGKQVSQLYLRLRRVTQRERFGKISFGEDLLLETQRDLIVLFLE